MRRGGEETVRWIMQLQGKTALVTGSSSGIGIGMAHTLAAEGCAVVVHGRDEARARATADAIVAKGGQAKVAIGDLQSDAGADRVEAASSGGVLEQGASGGASPSIN